MRGNSHVLLVLSESVGERDKKSFMFRTDPIITSPLRLNPFAGRADFDKINYGDSFPRVQSLLSLCIPTCTFAQKSVDSKFNYFSAMQCFRAHTGRAMQM